MVFAAQFRMFKTCGCLLFEKSAGRYKTWYDGIMSEARDYAATHDTPDQFVVETWIGLPKATVPDSGQYTFTNSVRDFARQFVR